MSPLTRPKPLLKFLGKTLLERHVEMASSLGIRQFVVVVNRKNRNDIEEVRGRSRNVGFAFAMQDENTGMAGALRSAAHLLGKGPVIVASPSEVVEASAYRDILGAYDGSPRSSYMLSSPVQAHFPGGYLVTDEAGRIRGIVEKPGTGEEPSNVVNIALHLHNDARSLLQYLDRVDLSGDDAYERALNLMIEEGRDLKAVPYTGFWGAVKYPWHLFPVMEHFPGGVTRTISEEAHISPGAVVAGNVVIEEGVQVMENAVVKGPCYIGKGSIVGNNALLRDNAHIGDGCTIGFATEIKHCYIGDGCQFHQSYVGDSIIDDRCSFGAGTITANLRFDHRNVRVKVGGETLDTGLAKLGVIMGSDCQTGVNAAIMPGVRVGPNSVIGPHVRLDRDLDANKAVFSRGSYRVIDRGWPRPR